MSNQIYSANLTASICLQPQKASLFSFKQKHSLDNCPNSRKNQQKEENLSRKEAKVKFRTQIKKSVHSGVLEPNCGNPVLRCDVKGMSMSEIFKKEHKLSNEKKEILNADNFRTQIFKIHLKSQTRKDQDREKEKMPFYQCQLKKMISCLDIILRSFDCRFTECQSFKR